MFHCNWLLASSSGESSICKRFPRGVLDDGVDLRSHVADELPEEAWNEAMKVFQSRDGRLGNKFLWGGLVNREPVTPTSVAQQRQAELP